MSMSVSQDSARLKKLAEAIEGYAATFKASTDTLNEIINKSFKESDGPGVQWYGPNALKTLEEYNDKCPAEFETAYDNIMSMAENLKSQAESWEAFENRG